MIPHIFQRVFGTIRFNGDRPVTVVKIQFVQAGEQQTELVLCAADIRRSRRIFHAEKHPGQFLPVTRGDLALPDFERFISGTGRHAAAVVEFAAGFDLKRDHGTGQDLIDKRLIQPAAAQFDAVGETAFFPDRSGGSGRQTFMRAPFADHQFDAVFPAEILFGRGETVGIDEKNIRLELFDFFFKIHDAAAGIDPGVLDTAERFDHIKPFGVGVDGAAVFQCENRLVGTEAHIKVSEFGSFLQKSHMAAVEHIVTTAHKHFFRHDSDSR